MFHLGSELRHLIRSATRDQRELVTANPGCLMQIAASVERLGEMVRNNPQETVAVLRTWIHDTA